MVISSPSTADKLLSIVIVSCFVIRVRRESINQSVVVFILRGHNKKHTNTDIELTRKQSTIEVERNDLLGSTSQLHS